MLKVHSRCDLACDHCYVYEHADQSWRGRPTTMSPETIALVAERIADHVRGHGLGEIHVVLHGGEPLLAGRDRLASVATELRRRLDGLCRLDLRIHTNGMLLDDRFLDVFAAHGITVGVSLDGDRAANDRHRRYADGRSSHARAVRAVELLQRRPELYAGLLCTIDVANDPIAVYEALLALRPPRVDFLLPHATWDAPPARPTPTAYADWLVKIYDRWVADGRPTTVRLFESIIRTTHGGASLTEAIGLQPSTLIVIETDGSYELVDSLKVAHEGAPATGHHVATTSLDEVAAHPGVRARQQGLRGVSAGCRRCPLVRSCGGGLYPHRYRSGSFDNPSVYCADLFTLIGHVRDTTMRAHTLPSADLDTIASGLGGAEEVERLATAQLSLRRALLAAVRRKAGESTAWDLLTRLDREHGAALAAVLAHPYVRAWAVACLRGDAPAARLANIAAAAAVHARLDARLDVEAVGGEVHLPTIGVLEGAGEGPAALVIEDGRVRLRDGGPRSLRPVLRLVSGGFSVVLEDADPYRGCHRWRPAGRLTGEQAARWQEAFEQAWQLIEKEYPSYVPAIEAGLTTIVPLLPVEEGREVSSAARDAFGAVAAALPSDPATLALLILHEFQHVKLGAVLDLLDLFDESDRRLFHAPWRNDPRPIEGLLQGTYAHLAVTDFWRVRRHAEPEPARRHFAHWRVQTAEAIETLAGSKALTPLGERFVAGMRHTIAPWLAEEVAEPAAAPGR
ncbi:FxsB family cyclophane-forming radical SAM/SPASM peptide maturase [Microbispora rosea]|uniref:FxsB family cyclophane-forming radical SAM/SPASM peptide maturase n=1 Tax=Microbispora rosea TaxID=58117 RepID=UPI0037AC9CC9